MDNIYYDIVKPYNKKDMRIIILQYYDIRDQIDLVEKISKNQFKDILKQRPPFRHSSELIANNTKSFDKKSC